MIDLIGHELNAINYNEEDKTLSLTIDGDKVYLIKVEGDCCSHGKFLGISTGLGIKFPQKIVDLKERCEDFGLDGEVYRVYEDTYKLENGDSFVILYDNISNGYYGSSLEAYYQEEKK